MEYSFTVPNHKEHLIVQIDGFIYQCGYRFKTERTTAGIKYSRQFNNEETKNDFDKGLSDNVPELWQNEQ